MSQFAILNAVWAVSIVLLEVPSGALADRIGRRKMIILASWLMLAEMAVIAFVPLGSASLVFAAWIINRILSGAAEAAASGADEALAYDSIPRDEQDKRWPKILSKLMTLSSIGFVVAMLIGAAIYDADFMNQAASILGLETDFTKDSLMRLPVYLTLANAVAAVAVAMCLREPERDSGSDQCSVWGEMMAAGKWILTQPFVLALVLAALVLDSVARLFQTSNSEYFRLIDIPIAWVGVIGSVSAAMGIFVPKIAEHLVEKWKVEWNYLLTSILLMLSFFGIWLAIPIWGVIPVALLGVGGSFLSFFSSHYLNKETSSDRRATVLSFKGLVLNIGFGVLSLSYSGILQTSGPGGSEEKSSSGSQSEAFADTLFIFPTLFLVLWIGFLVFYRFRCRGAVTSRQQTS